MKRTDIRKVGRIIANLTVAYANSRGLVQRRIEAAIVELLNIFKLGPKDYPEIVKGFIEAKAPVQLLVYISKFLPGGPMLVEIQGRRRGGFFVKEGERGTTIVGLNDTGRLLVEAIKAAAEAKSEHPPEHLQQPNTDKPKHFRS
jgi:hypothetical protein